MKTHKDIVRFKNYEQLNEYKRKEFVLICEGEDHTREFDLVFRKQSQCLFYNQHGKMDRIRYFLNDIKEEDATFDEFYSFQYISKEHDDCRPLVSCFAEWFTARDREIVTFSMKHWDAKQGVRPKWIVLL